MGDTRLGLGNARGMWKRTPGGLGELPVLEEKEEKRAIKRERRLAWQGREREGRANTGSLICSSSAFSVRRMNLMS